MGEAEEAEERTFSAVASEEVRPSESTAATAVLTEDLAAIGGTAAELKEKNELQAQLADIGSEIGLFAWE